MVENVSVILTNRFLLEKEGFTSEGRNILTYQSSRVRYWFSLTLSLASKVVSLDTGSGRAKAEAAKAAASRMNFILK